jgi:uncharacterized protein
MIRILPDTNIIISSLFWEGKPHEVMRRGFLGEYHLLTSVEILEEVAEKLRNKFRFPDESMREFMDMLMKFCQIIEVTSKFDIVRDKSDNKIIECAFDGKANYIVTGDPDVLQ